MSKHFPPRSGIYYLLQSVIPNFRSSAPHPSWLPQVSLHTNCKLYDTASRTILTQTFINPSKTDGIPVATYMFPLYELCAVVAFRCFIRGKIIEGVVKEKEAAKAQYNEAVARGETAGLLEQHSPDVFTATVGMIPPGETVRVEIEYIMELKHDAEIDGLRFTIPTTIAPRQYEQEPSRLSASGDGWPMPGMLESAGINISIQIIMQSNIRSIQSPSHRISIYLGAHVEDAPEDSFDPTHALAILRQTSTELDADFVLLVKCADLVLPRALLETHSTVTNWTALMVTLVPRFNLPPALMPEIVFVVDCSSSMIDRINTLKSVLITFLKSLPFGINFNVCILSSKDSFLWEKSQPNSVLAVEKAQKYVENMKASFRDPGLLSAIKSTISKRCKHLMLQIIVLTTGDSWNPYGLFQYITEVTAKGDVRLFSVGIGSNVIHSMVERIARAGHGFAQIITDEEKMEGKITRMLRGGLSAHVNDYRLEWDDMPTEEQRNRSVDGESSSPPTQSVDKATRKISLFNPTIHFDTPMFNLDGSDSTVPQFPEFTVPGILKAPYKLASLFPFSRSTAYVLISGGVPVPSSVRLRGTAPSGDELEVEIIVHQLPEKGETIHQLAARKILQELEEGTSYIHSGNFGVHQANNPAMFEEHLAREGTRLGVAYGLSSKWTSFVAVEKHMNPAAAVEAGKNADTIDTGKAVDASDNGQDVVSTPMFNNIQTLTFNHSTVNFINHGDQYNNSYAQPKLFASHQLSAHPNLTTFPSPESIRQLSSSSYPIPDSELQYSSTAWATDDMFSTEILMGNVATETVFDGTLSMTPQSVWNSPLTSTAGSSTHHSLTAPQLSAEPEPLYFLDPPSAQSESGQIWPRGSYPRQPTSIDSNMEDHAQSPLLRPRVESFSFRGTSAIAHNHNVYDRDNGGNDVENNNSIRLTEFDYFGSLGSSASSMGFNMANRDPEEQRYFRRGNQGAQKPHKSPQDRALEDLIDRLIDDFLDQRLLSGPIAYKNEKMNYRHIFLTSYDAFTCADDILKILIRKFQEADASVDEWRKNSIIMVMKYWLASPYVEIDVSVASRLREFINLKQSPSEDRELAEQVRGVAEPQASQALPPTETERRRKVGAMKWRQWRLQLQLELDDLKTEQRAKINRALRIYSMLLRESDIVARVARIY